MPRRRNHRSEEAQRVRQYKEAEERAKLSLQSAEDAEENGSYHEAMLHLMDARDDGAEAERLRLESAEYHGTGWSDEGHDMAIEWIHENIFEKADELEEVLKVDVWADLDEACKEMRQACQAIKEGCQRVKEASQQNANLVAPIRDMEQANNRLQQASKKVDDVKEMLEDWDTYWYGEDDDEGENDEDEEEGDGDCEEYYDEEEYWSEDYEDYSQGW